MMKKVLKWFLVGFGMVLVLVLVFAAFVYFSVEDRLSLPSDATFFKNQAAIIRLDNSSLAVDSLSRHIKRRMQQARVYGMAVSIISGNDVVYQQYFGNKSKPEGTGFSPGTIFYAASLSKPVFGYIVASLAEKGIIALDTPLYKYLDKPLYKYNSNFIQQLFTNKYYDYSDLEHDEWYKLITARMCLSHTTGLPNWRWLEPDGKLKFLFKPGTRYRYSGEGMALLQLVIEEITNRTLEDLAMEIVFDPFQMNSSSYRWQRGYEGHYAIGHSDSGGFIGIPKTNTPNAAGSMSTTLEDYTKFIHAVLKQENDALREMITPQIEITSKQQFGPNSMIDTNENDSIELSYGLGFGLYKTPYGRAFFKEGHLDGWQHYVVGFPERKTALILMSNSENAESLFAELVKVSIGNEYTPSYWEGYVPFKK